MRKFFGRANFAFATAALLSARRGIVYLLRDEFTTDASAPLTSPRTAEPGPGTLTLVQNDGQFSISGGKLTFPAQTTPAYGDQGFYSGEYARATGRALVYALNLSTITSGGFLIGWGAGTGLDVSNFGNGNFNIYDAGIAWFNGAANIVFDSAPSTSTDYVFALVLRSTGEFLFIRKSGTWGLYWVGNTLTGATLRAKLMNYTNVGTLDYIRVTDLAAPFDTDYGIATVDTQVFAQTVGSNLVVNGDFSAWTADNPDNWTLAGESGSDPEVTERDSGQTHAGTNAVGGSANVYSTTSASVNPQITSTDIMTIGNFYEYGITINARVSGGVYVQDVDNGLMRITPQNVGTFLTIGQSKYAAMRVQKLNTATADLTIDDVVCYEITPNTPVTAVADGIFDFSFALPGSPNGHNRVWLMFRISDLNAGNYWIAYLERNDANNAWDFKLDSVTSRLPTNRINVTGVGTPDTIRVITSGDNIDCYTKTSSTWTKRGATVTNSTYATATSVSTMYNSNVTPSRLTVYPRTSSQFDILAPVGN